MTSPVRREVMVNASPARAFELFIGRINAWWPLEGFGVFNDGTVSFEGGRLVERSGDQESVWGEVLEWSPPEKLAITWHPGYEAEKGTHIRVTFTPRGSETLVSLVHTGWERMDDPTGAASEYAEGWPTVLARFAELVDEVSA
jgi:uncharacterized protein YndB with AHSA1/START domain